MLNRRLKSLNKLNTVEKKEKSERKARELAERRKLYTVNNKNLEQIRNDLSNSFDSFLAALSDKEF